MVLESATKVQHGVQQSATAAEEVFSVQYSVDGSRAEDLPAGHQVSSLPRRQMFLLPARGIGGTTYNKALFAG